MNPLDKGDVPLTVPVTLHEGPAAASPTSVDGVSVPVMDGVPLPTPLNTDSTSETAPLPSSPDPATPGGSPYDFDIDVFDLTTLVKTVRISCPPTMSSATRAILLHGFVPTSPLKPSLAISLRSLELLRRICLFHTSYSVEAFAKLICFSYKVSTPGIEEHALTLLKSCLTAVAIAPLSQTRLTCTSTSYVVWTGK